MQENSEKYKYYLEQGKAFLENKEYQKALDFLYMATEFDRESLIAYELIIDCLIALYDYENAIKSSKHAYSITNNYYFLVTLGNIYLTIGKKESALDIYKQVIAINPDFSHSYNIIGAIYFNLNEFDRAIEYFQTALKYEPNNPSIYFDIGKTYYKKGDKSLALEYFELAYSLGCNESYLFHILGYEYLKENKIDQAIENYKKLAFLANSEEKFELLFNLLIDYAKYDNAVRIFKAATKFFPNKIDNYIYLFFSLIKTDNYTDAINLLLERINIETAYIYKKLLLYKTICSSSEWKKLINCLTKRLECDFNNDLLLFVLGIICEVISLQDNTEKYYIKAIKSEPYKGNYYDKLIHFYFVQKDYAKCIELINEGLKFIPEHADFYASLGTIYMIQDKKEDALKAWQQAVNLNSEQTYFIAELANAYYYNDDIHKAIEYYEKYCELETHNKLSQNINIDNSKYYIALGNLYSKIGLHEKAIELYYTSIKYSKVKALINIPEYKTVKDFNNLGDYFSSKKLYFLAEENYKKALLLEPYSCKTINKLAIVLSLQNKFEESNKILIKSLEIDSNNCDAFHILAYNHIILKEYDSGLQYLDKWRILLLDSPLEEFKYYFQEQKLNYKTLFIGGIEYYKEKTRINPEDINSITALGKFYHYNNDYNHAIKTFKQGLKLVPNGAYLHYCIASTYSSMSVNNIAEKHYKKALSIEPENIIYLNKLGILYYFLNRYDEAVICLKKCVSLDAENPAYYLKLSYIYMENMQYTESLDEYCHYTTLKGKPDENWEFYLNNFRNKGIDEHLKTCYKYISLIANKTSLKES